VVKSQLNNIEPVKYYDEHFRELHDNEAEELRWAMIEGAFRSCYHNSLPQNLTILDFGCSSGWLSKKLSSLGKVTGIDFSEKSIEEARKQYPDIDFRTMDINSSEIKALGHASFDLIVSSEVMEHIRDHKLFINQVSLLLKNDGILLLTTPNGKYYNLYFNKSKEVFKQPIENWISSNDLKTLLKKQFTTVLLKKFYVNWIYSSRNSVLLKILANNYLRLILKKMGLFESYLKLLEYLGLGLYLIVIAKKQTGI